MPALISELGSDVPGDAKRQGWDHPRPLALPEEHRGDRALRNGGVNDGCQRRRLGTGRPHMCVSPPPNA